MKRLLNEENVGDSSGRKTKRLGEDGRKGMEKGDTFLPSSIGIMPHANDHSLRARGEVVRGTSLKMKYCFMLHQLKTSFGDWAQQKLTELERAIAEGDDVEKRRRVFYVTEVRQFERHVAELQRRYLREQGNIKSFGCGDCGQLGQGESVLESKRPAVVSGFSNLRSNNVTLIACGGLHNAALCSNGELYTWGCNDDGGLGVGGDLDTAYMPVRVTRLTQSLRDFHAPSVVDDPIRWVSTGDAHTVALSDEGKLYFFGAYKDKEGRHWRDVGPPDWPRSPKEQTAEKAKPGSAPLAPRGLQDFPTPVFLMKKDARVDMVVCGCSFNAAILDDGQLLTWGMGECGELGRPAPEIREKNGKYKLDVIKNHYLTPSPPVWEIGSGHKVSMVGCGDFHMIVVTQNIRVATAGLNNYGQLGLGDTQNRDVLTFVPELDSKNIRDVDGGCHHTLCVEENGRIVAFGRGDSGQIGNTDTQPSVGHCETRPVRVPLPGDDDEDAPYPPDPVHQISCGGNHNLALTMGGDVYTWGFGLMCALGHGKSVDENRPRKVLSTSSGDVGTKVLQVCGGGQHSAILCVEKKND